MIQSVSDVGSNAEENIAHAAKIIGRSKQRRKVFDAIYTGKSKVKSVTYLMHVTRLPRIRTLDAGKSLADNRVVKQIKVDGETAYEKLDFYHRHKRQILNLAASPAKLKVFPTKRNPVSSLREVRLRISAKRAQVGQISIEDIDSFKRIPKRKTGQDLGNQLSEDKFKQGLKRIIGEAGSFKDWGGEVNDLYTTRLRVRGKRIPTAFALKGPAMTGKLTPGRMGANGDQIQRLFEAPAELFLVQYCRQIDQSVISQMERLAVAKSVMTGREIKYGVIDGQDSSRLVLGYPSAFRSLRTAKRKKRT